MDDLELQIKERIKDWYPNENEDELDAATLNLIDLYRLGLKIYQENNEPKIPENNP